MNPARSLGPAVVSGYWLYHYIYWYARISSHLIGYSLSRAGPLGGAFFAALMYRYNAIRSLPIASIVSPNSSPRLLFSLPNPSLKIPTIYPDGSVSKPGQRKHTHGNMGDNDNELHNRAHAEPNT
jgi:hypothetical protein